MSSRINFSGRLTLIAGIGTNWAIGHQGQLPWHMPEDLKYFKRQTTGKPILMGRRTYESIGRPLPNRRNIILSRRQGYNPTGVDVISSLGQAFELLDGGSEIMVIGGEQIYRLCLPVAQRILLTVIETAPDGDAFFPRLDPEQWSLKSIERHTADDQNPFDYRFLELVRSQQFSRLPKQFPLDS